MASEETSLLGIHHSRLLLSKLRQPRPASALIERPALLSRLSRVLDCPLTLISAPAGFGKTTMLLQWLSRRQGQAGFPPVAWVALDEGDNDPLRFWSYLFAASQAFQPQPTFLSPLQMASPFLPPSLDQLVSTFVNEVIELDCQGLLILEDYHVIREEQIHQTLAFLIDQLPAGLSIVLLTRTDPPFSLLPRLRARNQLLEVATSQLTFSHAETLSFLRQTLSFALPETLLDQIEEQTQGWIAGLRLFTLGVQGCTNPDEIQQVLSSFTGRHRYLLDYFLTEVLSAQPAHLQTFLLQTSMLQRLSAPLCDSVTRIEGSEQILAEIEHAGLFLQAISDSEGWYRYHSLFAEAMQNEARRRLGEADFALRLKLAQSWYEQNGWLGEAIEAAFQRHAHADVLALLERLLEPSNADLEYIYAIQRWLQPMPEELLATSPSLCFAYACALTFGSRSDLLDAQTFGRVMTLLQYVEDRWLAREKMTSLAGVYSMHALIFARHGKISEAAQAARQGLAILSPAQIRWRVVCQATLGLEARWLGHFQAAYGMLLPGLSAFAEIQERAGSPVLNLFLGELCLEQGTLYKAEELFQTALRLAIEGSNDQARALLGTAQLAYERNQLVQAQEQAQRALAISTPINERLLQEQATLLLARIAFAYGTVQEAIKMLQAMLLHLDPLQFQQQYREISYWQMRFKLASGDSASVEPWLRSLETGSSSQVVSRFQQEREVLLQARWLLQNGAGSQVLTLLKPWQQESVANERLRSTIEIGLLLSFAYHQLKQPQEARKPMSQLIRSAYSENYLRLFLDEGEFATTLLSTQLSAIRERTLQSYIRAILQAFDSRQERPAVLADDPAALLASLSPQERQVLRLLANGLERQEIADELVISLNTVKTHLQRLYQKLHVTNRFEAVEVARSLNLPD